ncbi:hypothetical protein ACI65C_013335 [Semiaphis heraclei]
MRIISKKVFIGLELIDIYYLFKFRVVLIPIGQQKQKDAGYLVFLRMCFGNCNEWLINCGRKDLLNKSIDVLAKYYRVCLNHFSDNMVSSADKSRLLPKAVPTEFSNFNFDLILLYRNVMNLRHHQF